MFYERLKAARKEKGVTQEQLAEALCLERSAVGKYESKKSNTFPSAEVLGKLSDVLDVSIDYLLDKTDNKNKSAVSEDSEPDEFIAFYGQVKHDLDENDLEDLKTFMRMKADIKRSNEKKG